MIILRKHFLLGVYIFIKFCLNVFRTLHQFCDVDLISFSWTFLKVLLCSVNSMLSFPLYISKYICKLYF